MRCMPTASAIVIATGRPSGTIETIWLMATMKISANGIPRMRPTASTTTNMHDRRDDQITAKLRDAPFERGLRLHGGQKSARDLADLAVRAGGDDDRTCRAPP